MSKFQFTVLDQLKLLYPVAVGIEKTKCVLVATDNDAKILDFNGTEVFPLNKRYKIHIIKGYNTVEGEIVKVIFESNNKTIDTMAFSVTSKRGTAIQLNKEAANKLKIDDNYITLDRELYTCKHNRDKGLMFKSSLSLYNPVNKKHILKFLYGGCIVLSGLEGQIILSRFKDNIEFNILQTDNTFMFKKEKPFFIGLNKNEGLYAISLKNKQTTMITPQGEMLFKFGEFKSLSIKNGVICCIDYSDTIYNISAAYAIANRTNLNIREEILKCK